MLKMAGVKLEKISDIDKYFFLEKELKWRTCYIAKRYAKANNKHMNDFEPKNRQLLYHTLTWVIFMAG